MAFLTGLFFVKSRIPVYLLMTLLSLPAVISSQPHSSEYQVKAVFLFNFTHFVEWPESAFENETSPMVIGILGDDPFGSFLEEAIKKEKVQEHPLVIKHLSGTAEVKDCHLLFINIPNLSHLKEILKVVKGQNILTIGDTNNFAKSGGVIRFYTEEKKIRIRINLQAAKENGLTVSSKLLRLADIVETGKN